MFNSFTVFFFFFFICTAHTEIYTLSLHDALPILISGHLAMMLMELTIPLQQLNGLETLVIIMVANKYAFLQITRDRKSGSAGMPRPISYAVFCLKKKNYNNEFNLNTILSYDYVN